MMDIPNYKSIDAKTVIFDYNGTLAEDGIIKDSTLKLLDKLSNYYKIIILTADTFGTVREQFKNCMNIEINIIKSTEDKKRISQEYYPYIAIGNGNNDYEMIKNASLGIVIIGKEGCSVRTLLEGDIVVCNIDDAINLLLKKDRLRATLRM